MKAVFHWHGHGHLMKAILQLRFSLPTYSRLNQDDIKTNTWGRVHSIRLSLVAFTSYPLNLSMFNQITVFFSRLSNIPSCVFIQMLSLITPTSSIQFHDTLHSPGNKGHMCCPIPRPIWPSSFLRVSLVEFWATNIMSPFKFSISRIFLVQWLHFLVGNALFFMYIFFMALFYKNLLPLMHFTIPVTTVSMVYILHLACPALSCFMCLIL